MSGKTTKRKAIKKVERAILRPAASVIAASLPRPSRRARARKPKTQRDTSDVLLMRPTHARKGFRSTGVKELDQYLLTLRDPFVCPPIRLGWGCYLPTSLRTLYRRVLGWTPTLGAGSGFAIWSNLNSPNGTAGFTGAAHYLAYGADASAGTALSSYVGVASANATNYTAVDATSATFRVVSGALRVCVRYPVGGTRGTLFAGLYRCLGSDMAAQSVSSLASIPQTKPGISSVAGEMVIDVSYRPVDPDDFNFYNMNTTYTAGQSNTHLVVCASGWAAGTAIDIYQISHVETLAGVDAGDPDFEAAESLSDANVNQDSAARRASAIDPVTTSEALVNAIDAANSALDRSMRGSGWMTQNGFGGGTAAFGPAPLRAAAEPASSSSSSSSSISPPGEYEMVALRRPPRF